MTIKSRRPTARAWALMLTAAIGALAWGSNYGITPGTLALPPENVGTGKITVDAVGLLRYMGSRKADRA